MQTRVQTTYYAVSFGIFSFMWQKFGESSDHALVEDPPVVGREAKVAMFQMSFSQVQQSGLELLTTMVYLVVQLFLNL